MKGIFHFPYYSRYGPPLLVENWTNMGFRGPYKVKKNGLAKSDCIWQACNKTEEPVRHCWMCGGTRELFIVDMRWAI